MKIAFCKLTNQDFPFELSFEDLNFKGNLKKINNKIVKCNGKIFGSLNHICDRCGDDLKIDLDENVELILSDGIYKDLNNIVEDVMEFFDGYIVIDDIMNSELEAYKSDYFYCKNCKNL